MCHAGCLGGLFSRNIHLTPEMFCKNAQQFIDASSLAPSSIGKKTNA